VRYEARLGQMARETAAVKERLARHEGRCGAGGALPRRRRACWVIPPRGSWTSGAGPAAAAASGRMIWSDAGGGQLFVPGCAHARRQDLRAMDDRRRTPRPGRLFGVDAAGRRTHRIVPASTGAAAMVFAVTVEPEGGVPAPTGPIVLARNKAPPPRPTDARRYD